MKPNEFTEHIVFIKALGSEEIDDDGRIWQTAIAAVDANLGFLVVRFGSEVNILGWYSEKCDAIEEAVLAAREQIASLSGHE